MKAAFNRVTGLIIAECVMSNINGDPDSEGAPRMDNDGYSYVTGVSVKRKTRDLIFDKENLLWQSLSESLKLNPDNFDIMCERGVAPSTLNKHIKDNTFLKRFWDARVYGNTALEESDVEKKEKRANNHVRTGCIHVNMGVSISPVDSMAATITSKRGVQEGKDRGMAPHGLKFVKHGIYKIPFWINPVSAHLTECTEDDTKVFLGVLPYIYSQNRSMARSGIEILSIYCAEHDNPLGSCPDYKFFDAVTPKRKGGVKTPSFSRDEYDFCDLSQIDLKGVKLTDLIK